MICLVFILLHFGNRGPGFSSLQRPLGNLPRNGRVHSDRCPVSVAQPWWSSACQTRRKMSVTYSSCSLNMLPKSCFHLLAVRTMQRNCSRPSDVISHLCLYTTFFSISQSCLAKRKHRLRTFPDELLPPALEPFSAKGNWGGIWFFMSFPPPPTYETCGRLPKAESKHLHWHWQRWRSELMHHPGNWIPLLLGAEGLVAQSSKIGNVHPTSRCSCLESSEMQAGWTKWLFKTLVLSGSHGHWNWRLEVSVSKGICC